MDQTLDKLHMDVVRRGTMVVVMVVIKWHLGVVSEHLREWATTFLGLFNFLRAVGMVMLLMIMVVILVVMVIMLMIVFFFMMFVFVTMMVMMLMLMLIMMTTFLLFLINFLSLIDYRCLLCDFLPVFISLAFFYHWLLGLGCSLLFFLRGVEVVAMVFMRMVVITMIFIHVLHVVVIVMFMTFSQYPETH